jgi:hypothetical protein
MSRRTNGSSSTTKMDLPANAQRLSTLASGPNIVPALCRGGDLARNIASNRCHEGKLNSGAPVSLLQRGNPTVVPVRISGRPGFVASPHPRKSRCPPLEAPCDAAAQQNNPSRCLRLRTAAWLPHHSHRTRPLAGPLMPGAPCALACPGLRRVGQVFRRGLASLQRALRLLLILIHGFAQIIAIDVLQISKRLTTDELL